MKLIHVFADNDMGHFMLLLKDGSWLSDFDLTPKVWRDIEVISKRGPGGCTYTYYIPKDRTLSEKLYQVGDTLYLVNFKHLWVLSDEDLASIMKKSEEEKRKPVKLF